jgi:hypothetical protein
MPRGQRRTVIVQSVFQLHLSSLLATIVEFSSAGYAKSSPSASLYRVANSGIVSLA